jgi:hypothetical protein
MKEDRRLSLPCHILLPSALKSTGARKPSCRTNQHVKLPEKMFLPWPATYPESWQSDGRPSLCFLYHDFCS